MHDLVLKLKPKLFMEQLEQLVFSIDKGETIFILLQVAY